MMNDVTKDFRPVKVSGTLTILGEDGRTCELVLNDIGLDRRRPPVDLEFGYSPQYEDLGPFSRCVANPLEKIVATLYIAPPATEDSLFTATFRPAEEG